MDQFFYQKLIESTQMKALFLCDIDGCLNAGKLQQLDIKTLDQIRRQIQTLKKQQIEFTLCTGRPQPYAEAIGTILNIELPIICENGSMLFFPKRDKVKNLISSKDAKTLPTAKNKILTSPLFSNNMSIEPGKELSFSITGPEIAVLDESDLDELTASFISEIADLPFDATHSQSSIDITVSGVNKGSALLNLISELDSNPEKLIGIGDSAGDLSFLTKMDIVLCPRNAANSVVDIANSVSELNYAKGILDLLTSKINF